MTFQEIHNEACLAANQAFNKTTDEGFGSCGSSHVTLTDGRQPFTQWARQEFDVQKGIKVTISLFKSNPRPADWNTQSIDKKKAWCDAYSEVLRAHGIKCQTFSMYL